MFIIYLTKQCRVIKRKKMTTLNTISEAGNSDEMEMCRICTMGSDCFTYFNIFAKKIYKNVSVRDALILITSLPVISFFFSIKYSMNQNI